jgi:hypothetical protein
VRVATPPGHRSRVKFFEDIHSTKRFQVLRVQFYYKPL